MGENLELEKIWTISNTAKNVVATLPFQAETELASVRLSKINIFVSPKKKGFYVDIW